MKNIVIASFLACIFSTQAMDSCLVLNRSRRDWRFNIKHSNASNALTICTFKAGCLSTMPLSAQENATVWPTWRTTFSPFRRWSVEKNKVGVYIFESDQYDSHDGEEYSCYVGAPGANTYTMGNYHDCSVTVSSEGSKKDAGCYVLKKGQQLTVQDESSSARTFIFTKPDDRNITVIYRSREGNCTSYELSKK